MKNLYVRAAEKDELVIEDVELVSIGEMQEKQSGQIAPISSQEAYLLFTNKPLEVKKGDKYYILEEKNKIWVEPMDWISVRSAAHKDNGFSIKILKSVNQSEN